MNKHEIMTFGLGFGILVFFFGIGIYFLLGPSSDENMLPQQISSLIKLSGMGITVISMIVGGFFDNKLDKDARSLLLFFGVILLLMNIIIMSYGGFY